MGGDSLQDMFVKPTNTTYHCSFSIRHSSTANANDFRHFYLSSHFFFASISLCKQQHNRVLSVFLFRLPLLIHTRIDTGPMMRYSDQLCHRYQQAVEVICKRWTGLILKLLMDQPLRFNELSDQLEVVSDRMLSERLKELEQEGIIERRVFTDAPVRVEYRLTEKGVALTPVIEAIELWSSTWINPTPTLAKDVGA